MNATWTLVKACFENPPEDWATIATVFEDHGIQGTIQTDHPATLGGYLYEGKGVDELVADLKSAGASSIEIHDVQEEDWASAWKRFFKPRRIGKRIVVKPDWEEFEASPDDVVIELDPGQAFGTGDHPTTRMCLELLEQQSVEDQTVADIGCGSGILSIAACKLGAKSVVGVDNDEMSVDVSRENATRNHVEFPVHLGMGFDLLPGQQFDLVLSNIISAALIRVSPAAANAVKQGGVWIVSGIIEANWPDVKLAAEKQGFQFESNLQEGEWIAAVFRR
ncbi:MAG: 50S ribosomal protein L11 methyltransferase [Armatimonadetes bacterium]|nr:50S ribosomal protein L11 methyltransferase [Armatimonadota bacterium]